MCSGVCLRRCAMRAVAGECGGESRAAACFKGAWTWGVHVLVARSARSGRASSESARVTTSLIGTVMPYDEKGHVCVRCMVLCIVLRVPGGRCVSHITCRDGRPLTGPKKSRFLVHKLFFRFLDHLLAGSEAEGSRHRRTHPGILGRPERWRAIQTKNL